MATLLLLPPAPPPAARCCPRASPCSARRSPAPRSARRSAPSPAPTSTRRCSAARRHRAPCEGPRLSDLHVTASTEGAPIPRLYGRVRLGGQVIWTSGIVEQGASTRQRRQRQRLAQLAAAERRHQDDDDRVPLLGKFRGGAVRRPLSGIGRVWADGAEIDLAQRHVSRLSRRARRRSPDPLIAAAVGAVGTGLSRHRLRRVRGDGAGELRQPHPAAVVRGASRRRAVRQTRSGASCMIPGSGEFVYATSPRPSRTSLVPAEENENVHTRHGGTDWTARSTSSRPRCRTRIRVADRQLVRHRFARRPLPVEARRRDGRQESTKPIAWSVAGVERATPMLVSRSDGRPAYGGTPADQTVVDAIRDLKMRGMSVIADAVHPDGRARRAMRCPIPIVERASQPPYPWRGRITCDPAPGAQVRPTRRRRPRRRSRPSSARQLSATSRSWGDAVVYTGPASGRSGAWCCTRPTSPRPRAASTRSSRHRAARPDMGAQRASAAIPSSPPDRARGRREERSRSGDQDPLRRRLVGILRPPAARRHRRCALPSRSAVGLAGDRRHRHRRLLAARRLARRRDHLDYRGRRALDLRPAYLRANLQAARASTGTTPARPIATRRSARPSPTATASRGSSATRTSSRGG